ncbi:MAG TPA: hypothetical protein VGK19_10715 [Capsulimonadaceae bacterium]|jgi:hypothetical protein
MKKGRASGNPLREYRRVMREVRAVYDPFTAQHCATCTTPCCIRPTRVTPLDVALATGVGHRFEHLAPLDPYDVALDHSAQRLGPSSVPLDVIDDEPVETPCEFLLRGRCTFPDDLRPFGCTTYICTPMYDHMPAEDLRKLKRLIRSLGDSHENLLRALKAAGQAVDPEG